MSFSQMTSVVNYDEHYFLKKKKNSAIEKVETLEITPDKLILMETLNYQFHQLSAIRPIQRR